MSHRNESNWTPAVVGREFWNCVENKSKEDADKQHLSCDQHVLFRTLCTAIGISCTLLSNNNNNNNNNNVDENTLLGHNHGQPVKSLT
jgi:hypothetical protein